jgi:hypothetical protein
MVSRNVSNTFTLDVRSYFEINIAKMMVLFHISQK